MKKLLRKRFNRHPHVQASSALRHRRTTISAATSVAMFLNLVLWIAPLGAQEINGTPPLQARGTDINANFDLSGIDAVNLLSGNLVLQIPIGSRYPAGGDLSYDLVLNYNSNVWNYKEQCYTTVDGQQPVNVRLAIPVPNRLSNAGLGWSINPGRILVPGQLTEQSPGRLAYLAPDGSQHAFYQTAHTGDSPQVGAGYSRDGSYLRFRSEPENCQFGPNPVAETCRLSVDFPNGTVHTFANQNPGSATHDADWRVIDIRDRYDNRVVFQYEPTVWTITDRFSSGDTRRHRIHFTTVAQQIEEGPRIARIDLAGFGGTRAEYNFDYGNGPTSIERHRYDSVPVDLTCNTNGLPSQLETANVHLLRRIDLPQGAGFYAMSYHTRDHPNTGLIGQGAASEPGPKAGAVHAIRLPTGGGYRYRYARYETSLPVLNRFHFSYRANFGVAQKDAYTEIDIDDLDVPAPIGTWRYSQIWGVETPWDNANNYPNAIDMLQDEARPREPCFVATTVTDAAGNDSVHYFHTARVGFRREMSLPFTVCDPETGILFDQDGDGLTDIGDPLEVFASDPSPSLVNSFVIDPNLWPPAPRQRPRRFLSEAFYAGSGANRTLLRKKFIHYEFDPLPSLPELPDTQGVDRLESNPRIRLRDTEFWDDLKAGQPHWQRLELSDFDGFGHYRRETASASYGVQTERETFTDYVLTPTDILPVDAPWILGLFDLRSVTQAAARYATKYCFDATTGFLRGQRQLAQGLTESSNDILTRFENDSHGQIISEAIYGGDSQSLAGFSGCEQAPSDPVYFTGHSYAFGARSRSESLDRQAQPVLSLVDQDIDRDTGLATAARDPAGVETRFSYDALSRLTEICRLDVGVTEYDYRLATAAGVRPRVVARELGLSPAGGCATDAQLSHAATHFDGLGRVVREERRVPTQDGVRLVQQGRVLHPMGWLLRQEVWHDPQTTSQPAATTYADFDRFGRAEIITQPDGGEIVNVYSGERATVTALIVAGIDGPLDSLRETYRDGFGRVVEVVESDGTPTAEIRTSYGYDPDDRLTLVCVDDSDDDAATCPGQARRFRYDGRGFLSEETHPEIGHAGNRTSHYAYDAAGNILLSDAPGERFDLTYRYDPAGRLTQVAERASGLLFHELFYARENRVTAGGSDRRAGKLYQARRHNRVRLTAGDATLTDIAVTETFHYIDPVGRLSNWSVRTSEGPSFTATIGAYDAQDQPLSLTYPRCDRGVCLNVGADRSVNFNYSNGFLTGIPGVLTAVRYHPHGGVIRWGHANGTQEFRILDGNGWRLQEIVLNNSAAHALWRSGTMHYDDAGNITAIGADTYRYDAFNRLRRADLVTAFGATTQQTDYDRFGNLTRLQNSGEVSSPNPGPIAVDTATNRLATANYDLAGNLVDLPLGAQLYTYAYAPDNRITHIEGGGEAHSYLYTAAGERFASLDLALGQRNYTPRAPDQKVLSRFQVANGQWLHDRDYIHAGGRLIATLSPTNGQRHVHVDHLGSSRRITDMSQQIIEAHSYYPFGGAVESSLPDDEQLQFTGHERDPIGTEDEAQLDYMHARYYTPYLGRFNSVDPIGGNTSSSQGWNRYSYVNNSPITLIDPSGQSEELPEGCAEDPMSEVCFAEMKKVVEQMEFDRMSMMLIPDPITEILESKVGDLTLQEIKKRLALDEAVRALGLTPRDDPELNRSLGILEGPIMYDPNNPPPARGQRFTRDNIMAFANELATTTRTDTLFRFHGEPGIRDPKVDLRGTRLLGQQRNFEIQRLRALLGRNTRR